MWNGDVAIAKRRAQSHNRSFMSATTPAIAVTAFATPRHQDFAKRADFDRYIADPTDSSPGRHLLPAIGGLREADSVSAPEEQTRNLTLGSISLEIYAQLLAGRNRKWRLTTQRPRPLWLSVRLRVAVYVSQKCATKQFVNRKGDQCWIPISLTFREIGFTCTGVRAYCERLTLGVTLLEAERLEEAQEALLAAVKLSPANSQAHYFLGRIWFARGDLLKAKAEYQEAIRYQLNYADAEYALGVVFHQEGNIDEALTAYDRVLTLNPQYPDAYLSRGGIRAQRRQFAAAVTTRLARSKSISDKSQN